MLQILAGTLAGVALGTISGIVPGIHANTMAGVLLSLQSLFITFLGPETLAAAMFGALITHSFIDILPTTFLGVPDADTSLAVLPAHGLCLAGLGQEAVRLSALGSSMGVIAGVPLAIFCFFLLPALQPGIDWGIGIILVGVAGYLIVTSDSPGWSLALFSCSGLLGVFCFRYDYVSWNIMGASSVLMPLLSGLFGIPLLLGASRGRFPEQRFTGLALGRGEMGRSSVIGSLAGALVGWLPGLSNATANALLAPLVGSEAKERCYIVATGAANTSNAILGLAALYALGRTRNGVMVAIASYEFPPFTTLLVAGCMAAACAYVITLGLSRHAALFNGLDAEKMNIAVIACITVLSFLLCGFFGLYILVLATAVGFLPGLVNLHRVNCMGAVMIPLILSSFGILAL